MAPESKANSNKRRRHYLPHNKPVRKGAYPLCPGVEGFFITCDGGRERQASHEAINVIDSFYEELVDGANSKLVEAEIPVKPLNKITKFTYSDSSSDDDEDDDGEDDENGNADGKKEEGDIGNVDVSNDGAKTSDKSGLETKDGELDEKQGQDKKEESENQEAEAVEPPLKKQCVEESQLIDGNVPKKVENKSIDKLIEEELAELGDKSKRRFSKLDSGCNGVIFIQMRRKAGDPDPKAIVQHMMTSLASSKKHSSRFLLRVLPVEVTCYTSDDEIKRAIKPLIEKYFPVETQTPRKFAVLYDARANTGIDRMKVIDAVAKSVPSIHKVDLAKPDLTIMVQIVKTVCLIGVVEKYKELSKYNLRQVTASSAAPKSTHQSSN
ncbi:uncharacterized protein LOC127244292 [Andrographis paniculata]|uniref:uncharacterized protein LOC127244292 n=1 Tax=Andrographis paniculata TaxID=175694 RepID=UPI0021E982BA|nr:uncharacterized protein LOC127244292 [Andrographis paniculata]